MVLSDRKLQRREALLQVMAMAARDAQPLAPATRAFAATCRGRYRQQVADLAAALNSGTSLPEALDQSPKVLDPEATLAARVGWDTGTLGRALSDATRAGDARRARRVASTAFVGYPLMVLVATVIIAAFLLVFVSGPLVAISRDFHLPLPRLTVRLFDLFGPLQGGGPVVFAVVGVAAVALAILAGWLLPSWSFAALGDRWVRAPHAGTLMRALAAAIDDRQPVPPCWSGSRRPTPGPGSGGGCGGWRRGWPAAWGCGPTWPARAC